ncbi:MAG: ScyD/ScyE family protein [Pedococcus sp.]
MVTTRSHRARHALLTCGAAAALVAATVGATAAPAGAHGDDRGAGAPTKVASGLDNPRQLTVTDRGDVYVAEAGRGGVGPCMAGPEGEVCLGTSGAVTKISKRGQQSRVVRGLPSLAAPDGSNAIGPSDVESLGGRKLAVLIGLGADPAVRAGLPAAGARLGTLQLAREGRARTWTIADLAAYEARANPIHDPDSNPSSLVRSGSGFVVTDAGGNDLLTVKHGRTTTTAVFQDQLAPAPAFLGLPPGTMIPAQAVPTAVVKGPDGAWYVSQLTGFPFPVGGANIFRVAKGHAPTVWATGLTNVTSLAFDSRGRLYAVQLADTGLLAAGVDPSSGSLLKVSRTGPHTVVADGLVAPYGVAVRGSSAYVSTCSVCAGGGEVWRYRL